MLDYLKTLESLTVIRDELRSRLEDENRDRQSIAEFAEASLTQVLGELVTPDDTPKVITLDFVIDLRMPPAHCASCRADLSYDRANDRWAGGPYGAFCPITARGEHTPRR